MIILFIEYSKLILHLLKNPIFFHKTKPQNITCSITDCLTCCDRNWGRQGIVKLHDEVTSQFYLFRWSPNDSFQQDLPKQRIGTTTDQQ